MWSVPIKNWPLHVSPEEAVRLEAWVTGDCLYEMTLRSTCKSLCKGDIGQSKLVMYEGNEGNKLFPTFLPEKQESKALPLGVEQLGYCTALSNLSVLAGCKFLI